MEVGWRFATKPLADDTVMMTEATADSREDNLSKYKQNQFSCKNCVSIVRLESRYITSMLCS